MPSSANGGSTSQKTQKQKQKQKGTDVGKRAVDDLPWTPIVQGQVSSLPIVFTRDAEFFFVVASSSVKIYSWTTGQLVSTLSSAASTSSFTTWSGRKVAENHTATITGLAINPANSLQLLTCSLDGTIKVWDYLDAVLLRTIDLCFPISHMITHDSIKGSVYVALRKPKSDRSSEGTLVDPFHFKGRCNSIIQLVSLTTSANKGVGATKAQSVTRVGKSRQTTAMALSSDGKYLVLIGKRKIHIAKSEALQDGFSKVISDQELTCLAFHPETNVFATGDSVGQIRLWYFLNEDEKRQKSVKGIQVAPSVLMHWHSHAVSALAFTPNGANLLSGGEESVMVLWQLATQNREYVPRLGGSTIQSISVLQGNQGREEEYVASLGDGSIAFVGAINLKANRTISQVLIDSSRQLLGKEYLSRLSSFPMAVQPGSNHLVMNAGHPSSLQFFDVEANRLISQMEIVPSNRVSRPDDVPLEPSRVDKVCFSATGDWMATIDSRGNGVTNLKVWRWDPKVKAYSLNSKIEQPHKLGKVTSLSFSPRPLDTASSSSLSSSSPLLLTTGTDNQAKTWRKVTQEIKGSRKEEYWIARSAFDYRNLPIVDACWEPNGSLLAVAHDNFVTLWEPLSNSLQQVISIAGSGRGIKFAGKGGRYLVTISDQSLMVWDIAFGQVAWEKELSSDFVIVEGGEYFSVLTRKRSSTMITTFTPKSSTSICVHQAAFPLEQICNIGDQKASSSSSFSSPSFYGLTSEYDVVRAGVTDAKEQVLQGHTPQSLRGVSVKRRTLYDELIGPRVGEGQASQVEPSLLLSKQPGTVPGFRSMFEVASHLLPPMSVLFEPMIQHMVPKRKPVEESSKLDIVGGDNGVASPDVGDQNDGDNQQEEEWSVGKERGVNKLRQVSEMDWSSVTTLFETQAKISSKSNGVISSSNGTTTKTNGAAEKKTPVSAKSSPKKSPRKSVVAKEAKESNGNSKGLNHENDILSSTNGRKRKVVE